MIAHPGDPSVEREARITPPSGHAARVLARSGPATATAGEVGRPPAAWRRPRPWRWLMPAAATLLIVGAATWQAHRSTDVVPFEAPPRAAEWTGKPNAHPVLPPQAYWAMSPFEEFESLRGPHWRHPSRRVVPPTLTPTPNDQHGVRRIEGEGPRRPVAASAPTPVQAPTFAALPPIVVEEITLAPLMVSSLKAPEPVALSPIVLSPIDLAPVSEEDQ